MSVVEGSQTTYLVNDGRLGREGRERSEGKVTKRRRGKEEVEWGGARDS